MIPDAGIWLDPLAKDPDASVFWFHFFWCRSDPAGRFAFRGLPAGAFRLEAGATSNGRSLQGKLPSVAAGGEDVTFGDRGAALSG